MNRKLIGLLLALSAIALPFADRLVPKPDAVVNPVVIDVPTSILDPLSKGFADAKPEAGYWSGLLYGMAKTIEMDATHPQGARLKTMLDVAALRDWVVACPPAKVAKGDVIGQVIGPELEKLGTSDQPLDSDGRRAKVVSVFMQSAKALEGIAK